MPQVDAPGSMKQDGWLNLPEQAENFEEDALRVCRLIVAGDHRIGKIPQRRSKRKAVV